MVIGGALPADTHYYGITNLKHKRRRFGLTEGKAIEAAFNHNLAELRKIARARAGVNLAEAFNPNPFSDSFAEVERLVIERQQLETNLRHHLCPKFNKEKLQKTISELIDELNVRRRELNAGISAASVAVVHAVTLQPE